MVTRVPSTLIREEEIDLASVPWSLETGLNLLTQARRFSIFPLQLHEPRWQRSYHNARDRDSGIKKYGFGSCGRAGILRGYWCVHVLSVRPRLYEQLRLVDTHIDLERDIADFLGTEDMSHKRPKYPGSSVRSPASSTHLANSALAHILAWISSESTVPSSFSPPPSRCSRGFRLGGHQHPADHAVDPRHTT